MINDNLVDAHYLCCNQVETWNHAVRHSNAVEISNEFIADLIIELVKANDDEVRINTIISFREVILR